MKVGTDPDVSLSEINQVRNELSVLDEAVSTGRLTTTILDASPAKMYSTVKLEAIQPRLEFRTDSTNDENDLHLAFGKGVSYEK